MKSRIGKSLHIAIIDTDSGVGVSVARADSDDGIVRVKSAVPMGEAIARIKTDIAGRASSSSSRSSSEAGGRRRNQTSPFNPPGIGNPPLGTQFTRRTQRRVGAGRSACC